jgi:hypothetical protein
MRQDFEVVIKVMGLSVAIALAIKFLMPTFPIPATDAIALGLILLPSAIVALMLKLRTER